MLSFIFFLFQILNASETKITTSELSQPFSIIASTSQQYAVTIDSNSNSSDGYVVTISTTGIIKNTTTKIFLTKGTSQSFANSTETKITGWTKVIDTLDEFDVSNSKIVVKNSGFYFISLQLCNNNSTAGNMWVIIKVNSWHILASPQFVAQQSHSYGSIIKYLNTGDTVEFYVFTDAGGSPSIYPDGTRNIVSMFYII